MVVHALTAAGQFHHSNSDGSILCLPSSSLQDHKPDGRVSLARGDCLTGVS